MRLLVVTARFPTSDRPAAGAFVRDRLADPDLQATVVAPSRYDIPGWRRYASIAWRSLTARGRFDGVEGHFLLPTGPIAVAAARLRGRPLVVYAHGADVREMAQRNRLFTTLARWTVAAADAVVTNSAETAACVTALGGRAEVVPPGIDLSRFVPSPRPSVRRVLYLGGAVAHKAPDIARRLADTVLGPGIREVAPEEIPGLLADHDILIVPSRAEPYGLVAAEAIASGRWVVARAVGGLREVVEPGVNGTLVERDDEFAAAIASVPDYDPRQVAATAARFDVEHHRAGMASVWARVLDQYQSARI
ncbi:MAG TPA: glycosyltransferase [Candidatus Dormibacteraeota bacterium]|nr:glycosyltransferase [Candidatus Dormibacteraeota bacterium]